MRPTPDKPVLSPLATTGRGASSPIGHSNRSDVVNGDEDRPVQRRHALYRDAVRRGQWLVSTEEVPEPAPAIQAF
jgi:hypothetical protein